MTRLVARAVLLSIALGTAAFAQTASAPNLTGAWVPMGAGRGADPKLAPPPAGPVVLKPAYAKEYDARRAADAEATRRGEPPASDAVLCRPYGMPRMMAVATYPVEILPTPGQITIVTEAFSEVRRIFLNQPQLPIDEVPPGYYGHSVGRWEGDTLVIDTVGIKESVPGYNGIPHSAQMRITERIRLAPDNPDTLLVEMTMEDPEALAAPYRRTHSFKRERDWNLMEFICAENDRNPLGQDGLTQFE